MDMNQQFACCGMMTGYAPRLKAHAAWHVKCVCWTTLKYFIKASTANSVDLSSTGFSRCSAQTAGRQAARAKRIHRRAIVCSNRLQSTAASRRTPI